MIYLLCIMSVNTMRVVPKARKLKERLSEFLKPRAYPAIGLIFSINRLWAGMGHRPYDSFLVSLGEYGASLLHTLLVAKLPLYRLSSR